MSPPKPVTFDELYDRLAARVLAMGFQFTGDRSLAEEVLQETFLAVHRSLPSFRGEADPSTWVYRISLNAARRARARRARDRRDAALPREPTPSEALPRPETEALYEALDRLPSDQREVLCLLALRSLSARTVAELLELPVGTVHSRAHHARQNLRRLLDRSDLHAPGASDAAPRA